MTKKATLIKQRDMTDCGAACLASVAAHYDLQLPIARIRQIAGTDKEGTSALGLIEAAKTLGFSAKGVKVDLELLAEAPLPCIAHVVVKEVMHHYVVVYEVTNHHVKVMDPAHGQQETYSKEDFKKIWTGVLLLLAPNESFEKGDQRISLGSRFWSLIKPHRKAIILSTLGAALITMIGLATAIYVQKIVDDIIPAEEANLLSLLSIGMLVLVVVQVLIGILKSFVVLKTGQQIDSRLILGYYKHILSLPLRFFDTMRVGEIISRVNDAVKIRVFINEVGIGILINVFIVLFSFGLMFTYYWKLAVFMLAIIPIYLTLYALTNRINRKAERKVMEKAADLESQLVESLNNIKTIKSFGMTDFANQKTETRFVEMLSTVFQSGTNHIFSSHATQFISRVFIILLLWLGTGYVFESLITPGELISFYAITGYFTGQVSALIGANKKYQNARIAADRLFEIMDLEASDDSGQQIMDRTEVGDIVFKSVRFRYGTRATVFDDLDLNFPKGKLTAIAGESGSGKSTVAGIIKRLYPIDSGKVNIGNYDLKEIHESSLNNLVGIVPQQVDLFAGTVMENVVLGATQPDRQRVNQLAEMLGVLDFINELPGGLDCMLGENGVNLSGGQRQRLAILRALYPDPEILIFDEATSALDYRSEDLVISTMLGLKDSSKTVIAITHRKRVAEVADRVVFLDNGKVAGTDSHDALLKVSEVYRDHWNQG